MNRKERIALSLKRACDGAMNCAIMALVIVLVLCVAFSLHGEWDVVKVAALTGGAILVFAGLTACFRRLVE